MAVASSMAAVGTVEAVVVVEDGTLLGCQRRQAHFSRGTPSTFRVDERRMNVAENRLKQTRQRENLVLVVNSVVTD